MVWRGVERQDLEEMRCFMEENMMKILGRVTKLRGVEERKESANNGYGGDGSQGGSSR